MTSTDEKTPLGSLDPRIAFFDDLAPRWDEVGQDPEDTVRQVAQWCELLNFRSGEDLLEMGCGTGQLTGWLAAQVAPGRVTAIDFSPQMLEEARRKHPSVRFERADVCRDDLGRECYDMAFCFHAFPHFRDQQAALINVARALRDGGRLLIMHLAGSAEINAFHDGVGGVITGDHLPLATAWPPLLEQAGLTPQELIDRPGLFVLQAFRNTPDSTP
jgi:SAM-dependent methyltransferase